MDAETAGNNAAVGGSDWQGGKWPEKPRVWIAKVAGKQWDLAPDGKRVVVVRPVETAEAPRQEHEVVFLENFFDELRRRVPASK